MFSDFANFKKATQILFKETCTNGMKLSQYRDRVAQLVGFSNTQSIKSYFESRSNGPQIVSVITYMNDTIHSKYDFYDDPAGNRKADELFKNMLKDYMPTYTESDLVDCLDDGCFSDDNSDYQLFITHSY